MSEFLSRVDFAWPWAGVLVLLPLLARFVLPVKQPVTEQVRVPFLPELAESLQLSAPAPRSSGWASLLFWAVWILLIIALARPEYLMPPKTLIKPMRNIVLILDVSGSMEKNDAQNGQTRLQAVQQTVRTFIEQRKNDRIGLVIFASQAWPFAPISEDKQALLSRIAQLAPAMAGQQTAVGDALGVAVKLLDQSLDADAAKMAILLTDGNDTASQLPPTLAAQLAAAHHVMVDTIAFGDTSSSGEDKVDTALLEKIAATSGGNAWHAATQGDALSQVWQQIDAQTPQQVKTLGFSWHRPLFHWPLTAALALLLLYAIGNTLLRGRT
ncbi:VWA domain-containing protein [Pantoea rwandensis]|uniref:VWA domain-containing protein n=1 Tax=Pantoea rwandensis TaxID=1076550 RepID=A0A1X1D679_9GAMM|nr:VWA domain-containing protein [Pantoea rwandensis]ORM72137.1 VWA domain-containing protein [Pantoea rwandensis]